MIYLFYPMIAIVVMYFAAEKHQLNKWLWIGIGLASVAIGMFGVGLALVDTLHIIDYKNGELVAIYSGLIFIFLSYLVLLIVAKNKRDKQA